jgi:alkylresorcinol/alkylpyrone synthase
MTARAKLLSLATAVPPHILLQKDVAARANEVFADRIDEFERFAGIFDATGIVKRHGVRPIDWYCEPRGWPDRTDVFLEAAEALFVDAASRALVSAGLAGGDVDTIVTVCSTGIATPSLEMRVAKRMSFRSDVMRVPIFGLGCAAGVSGLAIAAQLAEARPGRNVLFVALELCTLAFRLDQLTAMNIVVTALFADGAAACVLRAGSDAGIGTIEATGDHTWPDTLDIMGWTVDPQGFGVVLARALPPFVEKQVGPAVAGILARIGLASDDIDRFVCHPGGAKVVPALERALSLGHGALDHERAILADYGNMSSPTVLFVLERVLNAGQPRRAMLIGMGPGFTASAASLTMAA